VLIIWRESRKQGMTDARVQAKL